MGLSVTFVDMNMSNKVRPDGHASLDVVIPEADARPAVGEVSRWWVDQRW